MIYYILIFNRQTLRYELHISDNGVMTRVEHISELGKL